MAKLVTTAFSNNALFQICAMPQAGTKKEWQNVTNNKI